MFDRDGWRERVKGIRVIVTTWWWWWWLPLVCYHLFYIIKLKLFTQTFSVSQFVSCNTYLPLWCIHLGFIVSFLTLQWRNFLFILYFVYFCFNITNHAVFVLGYNDKEFRLPWLIVGDIVMVSKTKGFITSKKENYPLVEKHPSVSPVPRMTFLYFTAQIWWVWDQLSPAQNIDVRYSKRIYIS